MRPHFDTVIHFEKTIPGEEPEPHVILTERCRIRFSDSFVLIDGSGVLKCMARNQVGLFEAEIAEKLS